TPDAAPTQRPSPVHQLALPSSAAQIPVRRADLLGGIGRVHVLPDPQYRQVHRPKPRCCFAVPPLIVANLLRPELRVALGRLVVLRTSVPEAAVDEHVESHATERDVGAP